MADGNNLHNNPPEAVEEFKARIARYKTIEAALGPVTDENAQKYRDEIGLCGELKKEIEATHKVEKAPHLEAGRKVDAAYKPLVDEAETIQKRLKKVLEAFVLEREREARERAAEAARKLREVEEAAAKAAAVVEDEPDLDDLLSAMAPAPDVKAAHAEAKTAEAEALAASRVTSAAGGFAATSLRTKRSVKVTDYYALAVYYIHGGNREIVETLERIANAELRHAKGADVTIPGCEIVTERVL